MRVTSPSHLHILFSSILRYRFPGILSTALTAVLSLPDWSGSLGVPHVSSSSSSTGGGKRGGKGLQVQNSSPQHQLGLMPYAPLMDGHIFTYQVCGLEPLWVGNHSLFISLSLSLRQGEHDSRQWQDGGA